MKNIEINPDTRQILFMHDGVNLDDVRKFAAFIRWRDRYLNPVYFGLHWDNHDETMLWIVENLVGMWAVTGAPYTTFFFKDPNDAMMFKLRWGGE